jgi:putative membrane protein
VSTGAPIMRSVALLRRILTLLLGNAIGLVLAAALLDGVSLNLGSFVVDVLVFTGVALVALPMIQKQAIRRSEAIAGSSALLTSLVALVVTVLVTDGLRISGLGSWVAAMVIVWAGALVVGVLLPWLLLRRALNRRADGPSAARTRRR